MAPSLQPAYRAQVRGTAVLTKPRWGFVAGLLARHPHARLAVFRYPQQIMRPPQA